jgi:hypothetical protein
MIRPITRLIKKDLTAASPKATRTDIRWPTRIKSDVSSLKRINLIGANQIDIQLISIKSINRCRFIGSGYFIIGRGHIAFLRPFLTIIPLNQGVKRMGWNCPV